MYAGVRSRVETLVDTSGASRTYPYIYDTVSPILRVNAPADNANYGIWIGYGSTAVAPEDYTLESKATTTDFSYNGTTLEAVSYDANVALFRIIRTFTNISGASKTISEIGLVFYEKQNVSPADVYFLIARDVLPTPATVPDGGTITVRYIIKIAF